MTSTRSRTSTITNAKESLFHFPDEGTTGIAPTSNIVGFNPQRPYKKGDRVQVHWEDGVVYQANIVEMSNRRTVLTKAQADFVVPASTPTVAVRQPKGKAAKPRRGKAAKPKAKVFKFIKSCEPGTVDLSYEPGK